MSYILTDHNVTIFHNGPHTTARSQLSASQWESLLRLLEEGELERAVQLLNLSEQVQVYYHDSEITVKDGKLFYQDQPVDTYTAAKVLQFMREGLPHKPLLRFIARLQKNPSYRAVQELYKFLEAGKLPITSEGYFLAYKKVRRDDAGKLWDIYSNSIPNDVGTYVSMPRNQVDEDPTRTCSRGLHVCSYDYLPHYGSGSAQAVVVVRIDPADVVTVPKDYSNTKMRVCAYTVIEELDASTLPSWVGLTVAGQDNEDETCEHCDGPIDECDC